MRVEKALPAIISKSQFRQVNKQMRSRAPRTAHPSNLVETTDLDIDDFKPRIRDHRERQQRLEASAEDARSMLSERRVVLDNVETITAYAQEMSEFLMRSELTESRAFVESFVKEVVVSPGNAVVRYSIPMPDDSSLPGRSTQDLALHGPVLFTVKLSGPAWMVDSTLFEWVVAL